MPNRTPTDRQQKFIELLLADPAMNAVHAARDAGFAHPDVMGPRLRRKAAVAAAVDAAIAARAARVEVKADDVLRELLRLMSVDVGKAFDKEGRLLPIHEIPEDVRRAFTGIESLDEFDGTGRDRVQVGVLRKIKLADKARAVELAMKHLGLFKDDSGKQIGTVIVKFVDPYSEREAK